MGVKAEDLKALETFIVQTGALGALLIVVMFALYIAYQTWKEKQKQPSKEDEKLERRYRENSRSNIGKTTEMVSAIKLILTDVQERQKKMMPDIYDGIGKTKEIHTVITKTSDKGDILIYNRGLDRAMDALVKNSEMQTKILDKILEKI